MSEIIRLLREELGDKLFNDICDFIDELYLMDYDLLILMARKFFNLFCIFNEINYMRHEKMSIPYKSRGKVITNRALPLLKGFISKGVYKKVLIADDIIIHGRTIRETYDEVVGCNPSIDAWIMSYYRNDEDSEVYKSIKEKVFARYTVRADERRTLSDKIVSTFYISGRPYISYVPFFEIDIAWDKLCDHIKNDYTDITCDEMRQYEVNAIVYTGDKISIFSELSFCGASIIRFYNFQKINKIIAIPYFIMESIDYDKLKIFSDKLREGFLEKEYKELLKSGGNIDDNRVMEVEYIFSAWLGMYFFDIYKVPIKRWNKDIEQYNFAIYLLPEKVLTAVEVEMAINSLKIEEGFAASKIPLKDANDQEDVNYKCLYEKYEFLKKKYCELSLNVKKNQNSWRDCGREIDYVYRFIMELIAVNGNIDEKQYTEVNQQSEDREYYVKRLYGLPLLRLVDELEDFFENLDFQIENLKNHILATFLMAADSGRATIITRRVYGKNDICFYESLIHAGEQNFKFYEETNFPGLFGLYVVELEAQRYKKNVSEIKKSFVKKYVSYMREKNIFCDEEEMLQFAENNISKTYGEYLSSSYKRYYGEPVVREVLTMAANYVCN